MIIIMIRLLELIDKVILKYLNFRNLVFVQRTHCNDPGFSKWHHKDYAWHYKAASIKLRGKNRTLVRKT